MGKRPVFRCRRFSVSRLAACADGMTDVEINAGRDAALSRPDPPNTVAPAPATLSPPSRPNRGAARNVGRTRGAALLNASPQPWNPKSPSLWTVRIGDLSKRPILPHPIGDPLVQRRIEAGIVFGLGGNQASRHCSGTRRANGLPPDQSRRM